MIDVTPCLPRDLTWSEATYREKRAGLLWLAERGLIDGLAVVLCRDDCRYGRPRHTSPRLIESATPRESCPDCGAPSALLELVPAPGGVTA